MPHPLTARSRALSKRLARVRPPGIHVYDPTNYARRFWEEYLSRYGEGPREILLLGMNPGPYGMVQTGIPFGEVAAVRDWMGLRGVRRLLGGVEKPAREHPRRPILGLECPRSEVSGRRLWSWVAKRFGTADRFFARFFVLNYCPLAFLADSGANVTPDKLPRETKAEIESACDDFLAEALAYYRPRYAVGIGGFAEAALARAIALNRAHPPRGTRSCTVAPILSRISHPSPASPAANRGWEPLIESELARAGIALDP